jgi:hypothetical protein
MTTQELWQSHPLDAPRISLGYVQHRARELERRTMVRNACDYGVSLVCIAGLIAFLLVSNEQAPILSSGIVACALAGVYSVFRWRSVAGARSTGAPGVLETLRHYRAELERQRDARQRSWRWSLPLLPGLALLFASELLEKDSLSWARIAFMGVVTVGMLVANAAFHASGARRLQREIDALESLIVDLPRRP